MRAVDVRRELRRRYLNFHAFKIRNFSIICVDNGKGAGGPSNYNTIALMPNKIFRLDPFTKSITDKSDSIKVGRTYKWPWVYLITLFISRGNQSLVKIIGKILGIWSTVQIAGSLSYL